jgi:hypothetical protein
MVPDGGGWTRAFGSEELASVMVSLPEGCLIESPRASAAVDGSES